MGTGCFVRLCSESRKMLGRSSHFVAGVPFVVFWETSPRVIPLPDRCDGPDGKAGNWQRCNGRDRGDGETMAWMDDKGVEKVAWHAWLPGAVEFNHLSPEAVAEGTEGQGKGP